MKVRKEYTVSFSREEINKMAATVGYIYGLHNDFNDATCDIDYNECPPLQKLDDCLDQAKEALSECYNIMVNYCKS